MGGIIIPPVTAAAIAFTHDDAAISMFGLALPVLMDPSFVGLPSLLGRGILFHGPLSFDPSETVTFNPPRDTFRL